MERELSLIKSDVKETEKRVFPRFPFSYLTFKGDSDKDKVFEVKDISHSGMQLSLRDGGHKYVPGSKIKGDLRWRGLNLQASGKVKWVSGPCLGIAFSKEKSFQNKIQCFLSIDNIISSMRPIHETLVDIEFPANLTYWLRADGQIEVFVWQHNDHEFSKFQVIFMRQFVEWEDGRGIRTGKILSSRDMDTPLSTEDEFTFEVDKNVDEKKMDFTRTIVEKIPAGFLSEKAHEFLELKLAR